MLRKRSRKLIHETDSIELKLFKNAEAFRALVVATTRRRNLIIPRITCLAFSLELYLKCLNLIDSGSTGWGMTCKSYFLNYDQSTAFRLKVSITKIIQTDEYQIQKFGLQQAGLGHVWVEDFDLALRLSCKAFERFRYLHEDPKDSNWWASPIGDATRNVILSVRPKWEVYRLDRHKRPTSRVP